MKVKEIMAHDIPACVLKDNLKKVAEIMQSKNYDLVPVVDEENALRGVVTGMNICRAVTEFEKKVSSIRVGDVTFDRAETCTEDEKIEKALKKMSKKGTDRLIVTSQDNRLVGIISVPIILSLPGKKKKLQKKAFSVLKSMYKPRPLVLREIDLSAADN